MSDDSQTQTDKVIHYYNSTAVDYKLFWTGPKDLAIHFGYFDASVKSHQASLLKANEIFASYANITARDNVLDAGCGYGGSAIWLAKHIGCHVVGITIVPQQVQQARLFAAKQNVLDNVRFEQMDYTHTSFPDASFDVVWAVESIVHAEHKQDFICEAQRLLHPGGRFLIAEYMLREDLSVEEKASLSPWLEGWAMPGLLTVSEYSQLLGECGFKHVQVYDITQHIRSSVNRLGKLPLPTLPTAKAFAVVARALCALKLFSQERLKNIQAGICQNRALRLGQWNYIVIRAEKMLRPW